MDNQTQGGMEKGKVCSCSHHKVFPICIIIVGILLIIGGFGWVTFSWMTWEIIIGALLVIKGVMKVMRNKCKCC